MTTKGPDQNPLPSPPTPTTAPPPHQAPQEAPSSPTVSFQPTSGNLTQPPVQSLPQPSGTQTLSGLGTLVDSWADLIDNQGGRLSTIVQAFSERMAARQMSHFSIQATNVTPGQMFSGNRFYHLVRTQTGATLAVRIDNYGRDLYLSWDLWVKPLPNWPVILGLIGLAALMALGGAQTPSFFGPSSFNMTLWIIGTIFNSIWMGFLVGLAGRFVRGNFLGFFLKQLSPFDVDDITAMQLAVHHSLLEAADVAGISQNLLRAKETFHGGQRQRLI